MNAVDSPKKAYATAMKRLCDLDCDVEPADSVAELNQLRSLWVCDQLENEQRSLVQAVNLKGGLGR